MLKRKLWWGQKKGYTLLQWIQGDGRTQWIDFPGYYPDENWAIEIVATPKVFGTNGYCHAYGAGSTSSSSDAVICVLNGTGGTLCRFVGRTYGGITIQTDTQYTIYQDATFCTANGTKTPTESGTASGTALTKPLRLFRNPNVTDANLPKLCGVIQFSSIRAWNRTTGAMILDVVPVLDKSGVACFWDKVADKLYYNQGTGSFTYKEWDYTPVDYVYANGNAYASTLLYGNSNTKMEMVFDIKSQASNNTGSMGSRNTANSQIIAIGYGTSALASDFNNSSYSPYRAAIAYDLNKKYRVYTSKEKRSIVDEATGTVLDENNTLCTDTLSTGVLLLGAENGITVRHNGNIYGGKIWDGAVPIRDYIPVVDGDNKGGFYDKCLNIISYSIGTSDFVGHFVDENNVDYTVVKNIIAQQVATSTNTNACPYIKTGYIPGYRKKTRMVAKVAYAHTDTSYEYFCGVNYGSRFVFGHASTNNKVYFGLGAQNYTSSYVMDTNVHLYKLDWATAKAYIDDNEYSLTSAGQYDSTGDFWINARHTSTNANANRPMGGTSYWWKFWEGKKLVYNGIPVIRTNDSKVGLYETVKKAFQTTAGTVEYTYTA